MECSDDIKNFYINEIKKNFNDSQSTSVEKGGSENNKTKCSVDFTQENKPERRKVEVVVFKKKAVSKQISSESNKQDSSKSDDLKLIKARKLLKQIEWDVTSYGMKGFSLDDKRKMEQQRAISLGAKPRKPKYVNYKVLMAERKKQKESASGSSNKKRKKDKAKPTVFWKEPKSLQHMGQIGKFKDGVLKISRKDINSMT